MTFSGDGCEQTSAATMGDKAEGGLRQFEGVQVRLSISRIVVANSCFKRSYRSFCSALGSNWEIRFWAMIDGPLFSGDILMRV